MEERIALPGRPIDETFEDDPVARFTHRRGETEPHAATPARALRVLDGARRTARVTLPPGSGS
ncbi:hypothetical protein [Streptomyces sp. NEAU-W12]|uniref:hypothetical protein n=1 Tax=Streptomyces sp. NEAU-W12 TaxID=2994668 RepID=UPI00224A5774|nr:hypothetical protein [Streptomyces sp. NEAU-W12]MCX2924836.1 hypothetical protein [Streptomyces sp. NEAU-W12]